MIGPDLKAQTVVAVFETHQQAERGIDALHRAGFKSDCISVIAPDPREAGDFGDEVGVRVLRAGGAGVALGCVFGVLAGLLVPGVGPFIAAGPLAGIMVGLVTGGSAGGFAGMMLGLGLPRDAAEEYERLIRERRTFVFVHAGDRWPAAEAALWPAHPLGIHHYDDETGQHTTRPAPTHPSHAALQDPTEHVEPAAPDDSLRPSDVSAAIEGQREIGHTQWLDEAELYPLQGRNDT